MECVYDYGRLALDLERQELQSLSGVASPQVYGQLLAIYLLTNDLPNAKLLWKRIPNNLKSEHPELSAVWAVGTQLWHRDFPGIYTALAAFEWPLHLNNIISCIGESTRRRAINLIAKGFTIISLDDVVKYLGQPLQAAIETIESLGWTIDQNTGLVTPSKLISNAEETASNDENLGKLTEYVSFLEN